jgi:RNA polymerase subunit RPABC4/transcription elongation factor Spt4
MAKPKGKISALVLFVLLVVFVAFVLTPLALAPLGIFTGLARGTREAFFNGWHNIPWFPFAPLWSFSLLFVIIWFVVILWVYRDAERRRMSGLLWALLVFIGNLVGLLIYLIVRQDHPICCEPAGSTTPSPPPAPEAAGKKPKSCPACQKTVEPIFVYCPHCGASLQKTCPSCGKPVDSDWKVCPHCGAQLKSE